MKSAKKLAVLGLVSVSVVLRLSATDYYCDPVNGSPSNPGTSASPWRRLEEVFSAGKTFANGDTIYLRSGNHGNPVINGGVSSGNRTIKAQAGQAPILRTLRFQSGATHWTVDGVLVSPQEADGSLIATPLVQLDSGATNNTFQNSQVRYAPDSVAATWDNTGWVNSSDTAIYVIGANNQILNNQIRNTRNGVMLERTSTAGAGATGSLVAGNDINHFWEDSYRCKISNCTLEYNSAVNSYAVVPPGMESDPPHRDMFQSYRGDGSFTSVDNVVVRGNVFIARQGTRYTKVPFQTGTFYTIAGIDLFDGPYSGWTIENNVVMVEVGLGMSLYGVSNSTIVNNTVIPDPLGTTTSGVRITDQKGGVAHSDNDILRNNLMSWYDISAATNLHQSNNITASSANFGTYFSNYGACDLHLKPGSPAIDAGTTTDAPSVDADGAARVAPYDVGAYEFGETLLTSASGDGFHALALAPAQTGSFTATFDATPSASPENAVFGLSQGAAAAYTDLSCIARFNPTGQIDAYNGAAGYAAASTISYSAGVKYHFRMVVNIATQTYSLYVTPAGGAELTVGFNYGFRNPASTLDTWNINVAATPAGCSLTTINPVVGLIQGGSPIVSSTDGFYAVGIASAKTGTFTATLDVTPSLSPENAVVGLSQGAATSYPAFSCLARFNPSGLVDAYNGTAYAAASSISYSAGVAYHFRLVVNVTAHTYSVYVTPAGGAEVLVGLNYAFRSTANTVTSLDTWDIDVASTPAGATLAVTNFNPIY